MQYNRFAAILDNHLANGVKLYDELLAKIYDQPERYVGTFRATNAQTKLIQNIACSREIRFGDAIEEIITEYIATLGYQNLPKNFSGNNGECLLADQLFRDTNGVLYLVEQKMRDDHDSTKKRGQFSNFQLKYQTLLEKYPEHEIRAIMWFVDPAFRKNENYYFEQVANNESEGNNTAIEIHICYGSKFFELIGTPQVWAEFQTNLQKYQLEQSQTQLKPPNFDSGYRERKALMRMRKRYPKKYQQLVHGNKYEIIRRVLFPTGHNFAMIECISSTN